MPIVRVPSKEYHHIARACDMGAEGIMIPMVGTAKEAKAVVDCMKYYPMGKRGVALGVAHDNYSGGSVPEKLAAANERSTLFCQIETAEGAENADAIAAVPGVGAIFLGAGRDLRKSLGVEDNSPEIEQAFQTILRACLARNVACGITALSAQDIARRLGEGWKMIRTTNAALTQWRASSSGR